MRQLSISEKQKIYAAFFVWKKRTEEHPATDVGSLWNIAQSVIDDMEAGGIALSDIIELKSVPGFDKTGKVGLFKTTPKERLELADMFLAIDEDSTGIMEATE